VERLLLCHEEPASNAVRHGRMPVRVEVLAGPGWWLLEVSDAAPKTRWRRRPTATPRPVASGYTWVLASAPRTAGKSWAAASTCGH